MSTAIEKTKKLERVDLPLAWLEPNPNNPNEMTDAQFNMLCDNIEKTGLTDAILVRKIDEKRYRIVGGHHRYEVAKLYGFETAPCTIIDDPDFDDDQEKFQVVRMNVIRGRMSPAKFMQMYDSLSTKYADEVMSDAFGFVEHEEFQKLIRQMSKQLPKELQEDFTKAAQEIKTIDGLSKLLNTMFTKYGNTLPYGYMLIDFGGKDSIWLRMGNETRKALLKLGGRCVQEKRTVDDLLGGLIQMAATGKLESQLLQLIANGNPVNMPDGMTEMPTEETLGH